MNILTAYSSKITSQEIIKDLKEQFNGFECKMIVYFASSCFNQEELDQAVKNTFSSSEIIGCFTAGEILSGKILKKSVVTMALNSNIINDVNIAVLENIKENNNIIPLITFFENYYNEKLIDIDYEKYVGIILIDGLSSAEERIMDRIGDLTNVTFIGGSAGDDLKFEQTYVYANGKVYSNAAVLALIKPVASFDIIKTQSFRKLDKRKWSYFRNN